MTSQSKRILVESFLILLVATGSLKFATAQENTPAVKSPSIDHPLQSDVTGINWVFSLEDAMRLASETNRIMMFKPVDYRSRNGSDKLSPSAETLRAGAFVDQRVVKLINRRFVPYYFDLDELGDRYDRRAVGIVYAAAPQLRFAGALHAPPIMFMTPEGKKLGDVNNFAEPDQLLEAMHSVMGATYSRLTEEESRLPPTQRVRVLMELGQLDQAMELLEKVSTSEEYFLRGQIHRLRGEWPEMKRAFRMVTDLEYKRQVVMEEAKRYWTLKNYDGIKIKLSDIRPDEPYYQEAMYYVGLAHFHTQRPDLALEYWEKAINHDKTTNWALRLDWTWGLAKLGPGQTITSFERQESLLGRDYLSPNGSSDLNLNR